jgi:catechol 2,3-dioxygenase-like lactoylglutathione lyase family enzyme
MITGISYVTYKHKDLAAARTFYQDFGMVVAEERDDCLYFRGTDDKPFIYVAQLADEPAFVSLAFEVDTAQSLREFARRCESKVEPSPHIGGGERVVIRDPDGTQVELVHGMKPVAPIPVRDPVAWNSGGRRARLGRSPLLKLAPVPVAHLCHVVLNSPDPKRLIDWYSEVLGAYSSDVVVAGDTTIGSFMRFPRGAEFVDHHNIAIFQGPNVGAQHAAFETIDLDAVFMGHRFMREQGYKASWGPVRHALGGAVSDYWFDPAGFRVEHLTDGDVVNNETETGYCDAGADALLQWESTPLPANFVRTTSAAQEGA